MRMTGLHFFHTLSSGELLPDAVAVSPATFQPTHTWQQVHAALLEKSGALTTADELLGYAVYHYSVYQAFGQPTEAELAQHLFGQGLRWLAPAAHGAHSSEQLTQLCSAAWLHARLTAAGTAPAGAGALLATLDEQLYQEAVMLQPQATGHGKLVRILRYFSLRLPDPAALAYLRQLLARPAEDAWVGQQPLALGLDDGLAARLLIFIQLHKLGLADEGLRQHIRQGILHLLSVKREVDFLEQRYSVFPDYLQPATGEATFGAGMSWPHGDLGQSLLFYKAHQLLQDAELANIAELVGLNTLLRVTMQSTQVTNSRFYQGAAGVAYLYHKLHHLSQQPAYQQGYEFWLRQMHHYLQQELSNGFYHHHEGQVQRGLVGVGLVLLSAVSPTRLDWDSILL